LDIHKTGLLTTARPQLGSSYSNLNYKDASGLSLLGV